MMRSCSCLLILLRIFVQSGEFQEISSTLVILANFANGLIERDCFLIGCFCSERNASGTANMRINKLKITTKLLGGH
ncbi:MAG: hypothetical protein DRP70_15555 [Spirochaetes bacterium]|nr:MAG: hypothetical protein DRP70_15555 [Spirochaetota bacterium]